MSTSYLQIFILLFILNIWINTDQVSANGNSDNEVLYLKNSESDNIQLMRRSVWSRLFRGELNAPHRIDDHSYQSSIISNAAFKNGRIQLIPYDKRTIPIELRKALYAHGIVGRRR